MGFRMLAKKIGVDLGTSSIVIAEYKKGVIIDEPSVVALTTNDETVIAIGKNAQNMLGREPDSMQVVRPLREGVIADYRIAEAMLTYFIRMVLGPLRLIKPKLMICVPLGISNVEQRAIRDAALAAGSRKPPYLIIESVAAALGSGLPIHSPRGHMVLNIGGGRTEAAVISMFGVVASKSIRVGGDTFDSAIIDYIRKRHNLIIGSRAAEEIKINIGMAMESSDQKSIGIRGKDQLSGTPRTVSINSYEITNAISVHLESIALTVASVLDMTPPELASDVIDRGIMITGGGAYLKDIDKFLLLETGIPIHISENPRHCVAIGALMGLDVVDSISSSFSDIDIMYDFSDRE
ncbi:MAG: rod shape-determining protein MreB [Chloroflexi bacterium]|nr:MAG: rod shape-determining protein MreB [Chloroflexota bacterium]